MAFHLLPKFHKTAVSAKEIRDWDLKNQKDFPKRYKLNEMLDSIYNQVLLFPMYRLRAAKNWVYHRIRPSYIYHKHTIQSLTPGYHDCSELILHASFSLFATFMERQLSDNCGINWEYTGDGDEFLTEDYIKERQELWVNMNELYVWWTVERPNREYKLDTDYPMPELPQDWGFLSITNPDFENEPQMKEWNRIAKIHRDAELQWNITDEKMLIMLAKIRMYLWD
jgi:hypothetical protein